MKRLFLIILMASVTLSGMAQTIGEAFYIYRNDGEFNAFFRDEVISIEYSQEDANGNHYDEIVTQIVNTTDSAYKIPLAVIDSIGFVQPETIVSNDVFPLTAEHSPYISNANGLNFVMSASTPDALRPKTGNIVVSTAECSAFPYGIVARVESVSTDNGYQYTCSQAYYDEVFDQLVVYQPAINGNVSDAAHSFDLRRASLTATLWDVSWTKSIEGGGTITTLNVNDRATATVIVRKTLTTPLFFQLELVNTMTSSLGFNAQSTSSVSKELQIGKDITAGKITIPYTMGLLWLEPKMSLFGYFEEHGKVELNYSGHMNRTDNLTLTYSERKWDFSHRPMMDVGTDVTNLSMEGSAEVGLKPQIDFSLNGQQAGFGLNARVGLKEYINFIFDATRLADGGLYNAMRDSYCRTTMPWSVTAHANADIFSRYDSSQSEDGPATFSHTFGPANEPQWGEDRYIFPLFSNVKGERQENDKTKADASASVSRTPLLPLLVGFSLLDEDNNILQTQYDKRSYKAGSIFNNYSCTLSNLKASDKYIVRPSVKLFGKDVLASPSAELDKTELPVTITNFKQTDSHYKKDAYTHKGRNYSYKYDCAVTVELTNSQNVEDWGYVYEDPYGQTARISLRSFGSPYTDTRYSYYRNESSSTVRLYEFVKYSGDSKYYYGEPKDYQVSYQAPEPIAFTGDVVSKTKNSAVVNCTYTNVPEDGECFIALYWDNGNNSVYIPVNYTEEMSGISQQFSITGLTPATWYNYMAYIRLSSGEWILGELEQFRTDSDIKLSTGGCYSITSHSAVAQCTFSNLPADIVECGIQISWDYGAHSEYYQCEKTDGTHAIELTGLIPDTYYWYKAYAVDGGGFYIDDSHGEFHTNE